MTAIVKDKRMTAIIKDRKMTAIDKNKKMIAIIDCGTGNIQSVKNALDYLKVESGIVNKPSDLDRATKIIMPGVGNFGFMMKNLRRTGFASAIKNSIKLGKPFFGICLGLQILFEKSDESPGIKGLSIFEGNVRRFQKGKIPQIGWNEILPRKSMFKKGYAYFVNSFYAVPKNKGIIAAQTDYYTKFTSAVQYKNITATQFHPEKSGEFGLDILRRWLKH